MCTELKCSDCNSWSKTERSDVGITTQSFQSNTLSDTDNSQRLEYYMVVNQLVDHFEANHTRGTGEIVSKLDRIELQ